MYDLIEKNIEKLHGTFATKEEIYNYIMNLPDGWRKDGLFYVVDNSTQEEHDIVLTDFPSPSVIFI